MNLKNVLAAALCAALLCSTLILLPRHSQADQQLPDLIITDVWSTDSQICYTVKNAGQGGIGGAAPATFCKS